MNLNIKQVIAIGLAVLGVLAVSTSQLTDLFGPQLTKAIVSLSSLSTAVLSSVLAVLTSQNNTVKDVLAMPGVERLQVNEKSSQGLAAIAIDPAQSNIEPTARSEQAVTKIAGG